MILTLSATFHSLFDALNSTVSECSGAVCGQTCGQRALLDQARHPLPPPVQKGSFSCSGLGYCTSAGAEMQVVFLLQAYQVLARLYKEYGRKVRPRAEGFAIPDPGYDPEIHRVIQAAGVAHQHQWTDRVRRRGKELERAQAEARRTTLEKKPSIRERLEDTKRECRERNVSGKPAL